MNPVHVIQEKIFRLKSGDLPVVVQIEVESSDLSLGLPKNGATVYAKLDNGLEGLFVVKHVFGSVSVDGTCFRGIELEVVQP